MCCSVHKTSVTYQLLQTVEIHYIMCMHCQCVWGAATALHMYKHTHTVPAAVRLGKGRRHFPGLTFMVIFSLEEDTVSDRYARVNVTSKQPYVPSSTGLLGISSVNHGKCISAIIDPAAVILDCLGRGHKWHQHKFYWICLSGVCLVEIVCDIIAPSCDGSHEPAGPGEPAGCI